MRRRYTGEQRSALVDLVTAGRTTAREAARRLGVTTSTAYYWMKQAAAGTASVIPRTRAARRASSGEGRQLVPTTFVRVVLRVISIIVRVGRAKVQVRRGFDAELLRSVVQALEGRTT
jgi:transposase-like protein